MCVAILWRLSHCSGQMSWWPSPAYTINCHVDLRQSWSQISMFELHAGSDPLSPKTQRVSTLAAKCDKENAGLEMGRKMVERIADISIDRYHPDQRPSRRFPKKSGLHVRVLLVQFVRLPPFPRLCIQLTNDDIVTLSLQETSNPAT